MHFQGSALIITFSFTAAMEVNEACQVNVKISCRFPHFADDLQAVCLFAMRAVLEHEYLGVISPTGGSLLHLHGH